MKRKALSLILAFAMAVSLFTVGASAAEPTYGDTAGHWAEASIERWSGYGIIQGSNGKFDPNGQLTCAQLATILARLLKLPAAKDAGFSDNKADAWYYDAINRCAAAGILKGNGDGTVTPEAPITRERAMVMLARALGIEPLRNPDLTRYTDAAQVSAYAQGYLAALIEAGIVGGVTADRLAPQDNITRAATVTILDRAISTYADEAGETVKVDGKGIVLVVAENVKITGAPEGTKIVVADGATGLTVNGKSVSDNQTYIVPKTTTSSGSSSSGGSSTPSHSHSYTGKVTTEATCTEAGIKTFTCSCGATYTETIPAKGHIYGEDHKCTVCGSADPAQAVASINGKNYLTLQEAVAVGGEVKLLKDVDISETVIVAKAIKLDLNGKTIRNTNDLWGADAWSLISVRAGGDLTITGDGTLQAKENDCYAVDVQDEAKLTIENGTFVGNIHAVYVYQGELTVKGGAYSIQQKYPEAAKADEFVLNCYDDHREDGTAKITVTGGTFEKFNPANCAAEGAGTNFVAAGYAAKKLEGDKYQVVALFDGGTGTAEDPFVIQNAEQLKAFRDNVNAGNTFAGKTIALTDDVDLKNEEWMPIGTEDAPFKGTFDGQGHTITGLNISSGSDAGLIGVLDVGTVKNVKFASVNISTTGTDVGAAVGRIINNGKVENVQVLSGSVSGVKRVGGVVGCIKAYGSVADCSNAATVTATTYNVGGIVGAAYYTETGKTMQISGCTNTGAVTSDSVGAGGIVGLSAAHVTGCENSAAVTGTGTSIGGIVGEQKSYGSVTNCTNSAAVTNNSTDPTTSYGTGGIIGWLRYHGTGEASAYKVSAIISVTGNSNSGSVSGGNDAGGIIGTCYNSAVVTKNANTAERLFATTFAAGIVGNYQTTETPAAAEPASNKLTFKDNTSTTAEDAITASCTDLLIYTNGNVVNGEIRYTLAQFNALTTIPAAAEKVYVDIGDVSLADGDVTIGNKDICDMWTWDRNTDHHVGEILEDGRKVYMVRDTDTIYSSNKTGITLYISGSVNGNPEGGLNQSDSHAITLSIPDASDVVFTKDFTVNGYLRMFTGWSDGRNLGGAFYNRTVKTVLFDHSTFNGIWIQNGGFFADSLTLDGCTFNAYENKVSANDSNPLWFCNIRTCDVTVKNCTFKASRPIKVVEQAVFGANVTITDNKFDMSLTNSADDASKPKNDAIMFSTLIGETQWNPAGTLGNVVVSGNEVTGANALLTFFNPSQITMANGATFKVSDNTLNGAKLSVKWKTATEYTPNFVTVN